MPLRGYVEAGDAAGVERQAHTIKGASANVCGEALCKVAFSMEKAGKAGDMERIKALVGDMLSTFEQLREKMESAE
ncbi:MAG: Hpt domain-containing protein [Thermodesulfobacteriota bacterium]|nr:Hpt domain-containing protein [Thermodesulfobacteriota bacterium]